MTRRTTIAVVLLALAATAAAAFMATRPDAAEVRARRRVEARRAMADGRYDEARLLLARLAKEGPADRDLLGDLAVCLARTERLDQAASAAARAVGLDPRFAPAHAILSLAARRRGDFEVAIREARLAMEGSRVPPDSRLALADLLLESGLETEGRRQLARAVADGEGGADAAVRLALLGEGGGGSSGAGARARRALEAAIGNAATELASGPADAERLARYVRLCLADGRFARARDALRDAADRRELVPEEGLLLARALRGAGEREAADRVAAALPENGTAAARAFLEAGWPERALTAAEAGLAKSPEDPALLRIRLDARVALLRAAEPGSPEIPALRAAARAAADAFLAGRPLDESVRLLRADLLLAEGRPAAAMEDAAFVHERAPSRPDGAWLLGVSLLRLGFAAGALPLLREGRAAADPSLSTVLPLRAAVEAGRRDALRELLAGPRAPGEAALRSAARSILGEEDEARRLAAGPGFYACPLEDRLLAATARARAGDPVPARRLLEDLESLSLGPEVLLRIGDLRDLLGDREGAERAFERVADGGAGAVGALVRLAERRRGEARYEATLERLRATPGGEAAALRFEGEDALRRGDAPAALAAADRALAAAPHDPRALVLRFEALLAADRSGPEVEAAAAAVLAVAPGHPGARRVRAGSLYREGCGNIDAGELGRARRRLERAAELAPEQARIRTALGVVAQMEGRLDDARTAYEAAIARAPLDPVALNNLADLLGRDGEASPRALELARRAVSVAPENGEFRDTLAGALARAGHAEEAADEATRAAELAPESALVAVRAAELLLAAGRIDEAGARAARAPALATPAEREEVDRRLRDVRRRLDDR